MDRKIFKTGHSAAVTLSTRLLKALDLKLGDEVEIDLNEGKGEAVIRPAHKQNQLTMDLRVRHKLGSPSKR